MAEEKNSLLQTLLGFAGKVGDITGATDVAVAAETAEKLKDIPALLKAGTATLEEYRISLTKASGATSQFADKIREESRDLADYGVSLKNLVNYNVQIADSFNKAAFSSAETRKQFQDQRVELQNLIAFNDKFGVSSSTTIGIVNKLGNSIFQSTKEVTKFSDSLWQFSRTTGQSFSNVLSEFNTYSDRFIQTYSTANFDKGAQIFGNIELLAKRAGMSVSSLVGSIQKFDDIDTAFSSGGQINRVLSYFGGSFDTLAAANASDEERAQMLFKSISEIGDAFNQQMTNPAARRAMLKELESATGFTSQQLVGLMDKNKSMADDLRSISERPVPLVPKVLDEEERKRQMLAVTTKEEVKGIEREMLTLGPLTSALEKLQNNQKDEAIGRAKTFANTLDKAVKQVLGGEAGTVTGVFSIFNNIETTFKDFMTGKDGVATKVKEAFSKGEVMKALEQSYTKNTKSVESDAFQKRLDRSVEVLQKSQAIHAEKAGEAISKTAAAEFARVVPKEVQVTINGEFRIDNAGNTMSTDAASLVTQIKPIPPTPKPKGK